MQITIKSTRIIKEGTQAKSGQPYKWCSVIAEDGTEKGTEYTTFDTGILKLGPGSIIEIGEPVIKGGKLSFKSIESIVKEVSATSAEAPTNNGKSVMTPEQWERKDRLEQLSRERNACFMGLPALIAAEPKDKSLAREVWETAMRFAKERLTIQTNANSQKKDADSATLVPAYPDDWDGGANAGEFYTACLRKFRLSKSSVDKEIPEYDLSNPNQRKSAWQTIVGIYGQKPETDTKAEDPNDPDHLFG